MAKGTTARQREKKKSYSTSKNFTNSTPGSSASSDVSPKTENLHNQSLWRYFVFVILLSVGSVSLFFMKDTEFVSRTWRSIQVSHAFYSSTDQNDEQLPCNSGDNFTVDRRFNLSLEEFIRCYDAKRPVVITDVVRSWKAMNWTKSFLVSNYGDKRVSMKATEGPLNKAQGFAVPLKIFAAHVHEGQPEIWTYLEDELFIEMNPELRDYLGQPVYLKEDFFQLLPREIRPWNAMLLWGTAHSRSSLHIDPYNWTGTNAVLSGKKMWKLYPPGQDHLLYVKQRQRCGFPLDCWKYNSPIDAYNPDYKKYPKFRQAKAISFTQEAGDLFIIPTGWFHQAYNPVETMAISSQVMNSQNYKLVLDEIYKGGEVDPRKLPRNFHSLSAREQVEAVVKIIPMKIIGKGKKVTEDILNQLKWKGKGKQHNK